MQHSGIMSWGCVVCWVKWATSEFLSTAWFAKVGRETISFQRKGWDQAEKRCRKSETKGKAWVGFSRMQKAIEKTAPDAWLIEILQLPMKKAQQWVLAESWQGLGRAWSWGWHRLSESAPHTYFLPLFCIHLLPAGQQVSQRSATLHCLLHYLFCSEENIALRPSSHKLLLSESM